MASDADLYGRDLAWVDGDFVLDSRGLATVEGLDCLRQDLAARVLTAPGELYWDLTAGLDLEGQQQADLDQHGLDRLRLNAQRELERDGRVDQCFVEVVAMPGDLIEVRASIVPVESAELIDLVVTTEGA